MEVEAVKATVKAVVMTWDLAAVVVAVVAEAEVVEEVAPKITKDVYT